MIYSVFNWSTQEYDYFEGPGEQLGQRPVPRVKVNDPKGNARQMEALLPVLPDTATFLGTGETAKGRIAVHHTSPAAQLDGYPDPNPSSSIAAPSLTALGIGALALYAGYKLLTKF